MTRLGPSPRLNERAHDMAAEQARYNRALEQWEKQYEAELAHVMSQVSEAWAHDPGHLAFIQDTWAQMGAEGKPRASRYAGLTYLRWALRQTGARTPSRV